MNVLYVLSICLLLMAQSARAFEVSAYFEPYSVMNYSNTRSGANFGDCDTTGWDRDDWLRHVDAGNTAQALQWFSLRNRPLT